MTTFDYTAGADRILAAWDDSDAETKRLGAEWYPLARRQASTMLGGLYDSERVDTACGVVAALSPRCKWATNLAWAAQVLAAKRQRKGCPAVHTTAMRTQAWRIAGGEDPLTVLNGPKVRAFYGNLTGDDRSVTVDVWATRLALGMPNVHGPGKLYEDIAAAYRFAALRRGVAPSTMQATTWIYTRGKAD